MRTRKSILALLLCLSLLTGLLAGCTKPATPATQTNAPTDAPKNETAPPETQPPEDLGAEYQAALEALEAEPNLTIVTEIHQDATLGGDAVVEKQTETVRYQNRGTDNLIVSSQRRIRYSDGSINMDQLYSGEKLYSVVEDESRFWAPETAENFLSLQTPLAMLNPANYGSVTRDGDKLRFSDPVEPEAWAIPAGADLQEVSASATLKDGVLTAQSYDITYLYAGSPIHCHYASTLSKGVDADLAALVPAGTGEYTKLQSSEALLLLLRAFNALGHTRMFSVDINTTLVSQAANVIRSDRETVHTYGLGQEKLLLDEMNLQAMDFNGQAQDSYTFTQKLIGNVYTYSENGGEPVEEELDSTRLAATFSNALNTLQYSVSSYLPSIWQLKDAVVYDAGDYLLMEYQADDSFSEEMDRQANYKLFQNETALMDMAEKYAPATMEGYLAVEKNTWLPTAVGTNYVASHVIDGSSYRIGLEQRIGLSLYDQDTYEEITGEPLPDREPEQKPTPVFYEVEDSNGAKLYLFGTIHVGDDRTAFLPQAIYDALDSADALAVEFDDKAFEEELSNNPELMQKVAEAYYYTDGSTISDHLEEELYESAQRFLKITGSYTAQAEQMKPFVWEGTLSNFYLAQGRKLTSSKGVDHRLMARARAQEKEILDVESGEAQLGMLGGYSDKLQQLLLEETMNTSRSDYLSGTYELYDLWCQGDEAVLIQRLAAADQEELEEMTEEERALYEEYHSAMETSRNTDMLEVAQTYLESGKTVFFAVGLAHLLGDGGLVQALRDAGYTVTLIQG
ncbi:MAG: TraB/GumN family protein [Oscillospiraceae bacterium]|nr:TraB/GumN family protein [Oscillospiraceae bacterium]